MNISGLFEKRDKLTLHVESKVRVLIAVLIIIGVVSMVAGLISGNERRTWSALLFNAFFFFNIALIGAAFGNMQDVIAASWGRPIKKIHESFGAFLPVGAALLAFILIACMLDFQGAKSVYSWMVNPESIQIFWGKDVWLQEKFMVIRNIGALAGILLLSSWHLSMVKKRDKLFLDGDKQKALEYGKKVQKKLQYWSAPILVFYSLAFSLIGFDMLMSISPVWFSTLFGGWLFAVGMQSMLALLLIVLLWVREGPVFSQVIKTPHLHDIGKLLYGFTIFFAYLTYAHVLTYWYGNVPEETEYYIDRLQDPWLTMVLIIPIFVFILPLFALIPKAAKYTKGYTHALCVSILVSQWFVMLVIVMPEALKGHEGVYFPGIELGLLCGVGGLFLWRFLQFNAKSPIVGPADPLLPNELVHDHH